MRDFTNGVLIGLGDGAEHLPKNLADGVLLVLKAARSDSTVSFADASNPFVDASKTVMTPHFWLHVNPSGNMVFDPPGDCLRLALTDDPQAMCLRCEVWVRVQSRATRTWHLMHKPDAGSPYYEITEPDDPYPDCETASCHAVAYLLTHLPDNFQIPGIPTWIEQVKRRQEIARQDRKSLGYDQFDLTNPVLDANVVLAEK